MVKCPECGKEVKDSNFCNLCGAKLNKPKLCPKCDSELDEDSVFCPECGEKVIDEEKTSDEDKEEAEEKTSDDDEKESEKEDEDSSDEIDESEEKTEEDSEPEDKEETDKDKKETKDKKSKQVCPHCDTKIYDDGVDFCPECGKSINFDVQSFEGIKHTIQMKRVIIFTLISILFSALLSVIFSLILRMSPTDLYPVGFFLSLLIVVGIFGSFKDLINGGLVGIFTGLVLGLLSGTIVELANGFTFSYVMFLGYAPIVFTIFGAIVGVLSTKFLRNSVSKHVDVEKLF